MAKVRSTHGVGLPFSKKRPQGEGREMSRALRYGVPKTSGG